MQDEVRRILENIAKKYDLSLKHVARIYRSPYITIREIWHKIDYQDPESYKAVNLYLIALGTFFVRESKIHKVNAKIHELKSSQIEKHTSTSSDSGDSE